MNYAFYLATPKDQNQGMRTQNAYCLSNKRNADFEFLAKPRRANFQALTFVVISFVKAISLHVEKRLEVKTLESSQMKRLIHRATPSVGF